MSIFDRVICYGLSDEAITAPPTWSCATLARYLAFTAAKKNSAKLFSMFPGEHNVRNALGVIALANELGVTFEKIAKSLTKFQHARRRFEILVRQPALFIGRRLRAPPDRNQSYTQDRKIGRPQALVDNVSTAPLLAHQSAGGRNLDARSTKQIASSSLMFTDSNESPMQASLAN